MVNLNLSCILRSYIHIISCSEVSNGVVHVRTAAEAGGSGCACADGPLREVDRARRTFGREVTCCEL